MQCYSGTTNGCTLYKYNKPKKHKWKSESATISGKSKTQHSHKYWDSNLMTVASLIRGKNFAVVINDVKQKNIGLK